MLMYPVKLTPDDNGTVMIEIPDIPEVTSVGDDEDEALLNVREALECAIQLYFDERRPVPMPSKPQQGQAVVCLPALETSKVLLWNEMLGQKIRKAELARRLNVYMPQIDRLFDLKHSSKIEFVERAFNAIGKQLSISVM
ncbi:type II toxin-antitoxin system HicB family antitoxin [Oxalobacter aliiformigenes]|uniref:type II toxin-antitoxin system HicB family antitoxin n=1 Tax=Oxalobacter aliiformigenes TaxID=2946593 RepID=UPI0022B03F5F|nr:type II toxin-antitoxin system HicB family antitoxin [Oxalobacter aliiformigenes]MCZ4065709.1 type II toxin-antitoxin system HicB family antitoxin [Oxalobacter aliiformigenes]WAV98659.1 type II toxin-antitoxin system HicB family antitoxin [Oxalobacter aliiformigenes]